MEVLVSTEVVSCPNFCTCSSDYLKCTLIFDEWDDCKPIWIIFADFQVFFFSLQKWYNVIWLGVHKLLHEISTYIWVKNFLNHYVDEFAFYTTWLNIMLFVQMKVFSVSVTTSELYSSSCPQNKTQGSCFSLFYSSCVDIFGQIGLISNLENLCSFSSHVCVYDDKPSALN